MIRLILCATYLILYLILLLPVAGIEWIIKKINNHAGDIAALRTVQWGFRCITKLSGAKVQVYGRENLTKDKDKPMLYIANHRSIFDVIILYTLFYERTGFIAKKSIEKVPSLRMWMRKLHCLFLDRSDMKQGLKIILTAIDKVKEGISIVVFPEGTRTKTGELLPFKAGPFKIATKTNCPIVPIAITGTDDIIENHIPFVKSADVVITIGEPVEVADLSADEKKHIGDHFQGIVENMLEDNKKLLAAKQEALESK